MWYPATVTVAAETNEALLAAAKAHVYAADFTDDDAILQIYLDAAVAHAEAYCGIRIAQQTIAVKCDCFDDFEQLPVAPVQSISSITYIDADGVQQTLSTDVYEVRNDELSVSIALKYNQNWPAIRSGSRITVTAVVGWPTMPPPIKYAILLSVADYYRYRETAVPDGYKFREGAIDADWTAFDSLLVNYRRSAA